MELFTVDNAIETYPYFVYLLGTTPDEIYTIAKTSIFIFLTIILALCAAVYWMMKKPTVLSIVVVMILVIAAPPLTLTPYNSYLNNMEPRGEEQQRDIIASALEKPEYQEKVESEFNDLGTSIDDVCSNEKNYPSLLCFKEKNGNVTWVGDKENQPVTWTDDGVSYSMNLVSEYDEKTDQITVSLKWEAESN